MPEASNDVFVPDLWDVGLEKELEKALVFAKWTERKYEGKLEQPGDQVRIMTPGSVEVKRLDWSDDEDRKKFESNLGEPQGMTGAGQTLAVYQITYYQIIGSDLSKKLSNKNLWKSYLEDSSKQVKDDIDQYIGDFADKFPLFENKAYTVNVNNITNVLSKMKTTLKKQNVTEELKMEVPFEFVDVLLKAYEKGQANSERLMKEGKVTSSDNSAVYHEMIFEGSNNVKLKDGYYYSMLRTKRALAFVNRCAGSEIIRSSTGFSDIFRGYALFDAKVIRRKEGLCLKYKVDVDVEKYVLAKLTPTE